MSKNQNDDLEAKIASSRPDFGIAMRERIMFEAGRRLGKRQGVRSAILSSIVSTSIVAFAAWGMVGWVPKAGDSMQVKIAEQLPVPQHNESTLPHVIQEPSLWETADEREADRGVLTVASWRRGLDFLDGMGRSNESISSTDVEKEYPIDSPPLRVSSAYKWY